MTVVKVCFGAEIHRISTLHPAFEDLTRYIGSIFHSTLPQKWILYYMDDDGDKIIIADQKDYDQFKSPESSSCAIPKLYIIPAEVHSTNEIEFKTEADCAMDNNGVKSSRIASEERKEKEGNDNYETKGNLQNFQLEKTNVDQAQKESENETKKSKVDNESVFTNKTQATQVIHYGIKCNGCRIEPILGTRYKCLTCAVFNYCEECEKTGGHSHNFIKMKQRDVSDMFKPSKLVVTKPETPTKHDKEHNLETKSKINKASSGSGQAYFEALIEKVKVLHKKFPKASVTVLCAYVNGAPEDMGIEELIENYKY